MLTTMAMVMLTVSRRLERGSGQTKSSWEVIGRRGGGRVPGFSEGHGEMGAGGEEECKGAAAASVVGI